jgi:hypothetical protein
MDVSSLRVSCWDGKEHDLSRTDLSFSRFFEKRDCFDDIFRVNFFGDADCNKHYHVVLCRRRLLVVGIDFFFFNK